MKMARRTGKKTAKKAAKSFTEKLYEFETEMRTVIDQDDVERWHEQKSWLSCGDWKTRRQLWETSGDATLTRLIKGMGDIPYCTGYPYSGPQKRWPATMFPLEFITIAQEVYRHLDLSW